MEFLVFLAALGFIIFLVIRLDFKPTHDDPNPQERPARPRPPAQSIPKRSRPAPSQPAHDQQDIPTPAGARFDVQTSSAPTARRKCLSGRAYVVDGDTIKIQRTQIRLFGIDAPEINHPYGRKAKSAMFELCKGQIITAEITAMDDHGRTVAKCFLPDGRDLSAEMVKQGMAIDWPKFSGGIYRAMETADARRKLWLADARQKGRMHVWHAYDAREREKAAQRRAQL